jgi:hypothetical protein
MAVRFTRFINTHHPGGPPDPGELPVEPDEGPSTPPAKPNDPSSPLAPPH